MIYTDNSRNDSGNYNIYAASYDPEQADEEILIHAVETDEEWQRIEMMLQRAFILYRMEVMLLKHFDFRDLMSFGMFILALLTFVFAFGK